MCQNILMDAMCILKLLIKMKIDVCADFKLFTKHNTTIEIYSEIDAVTS